MDEIDKVIRRATLPVRLSHELSWKALKLAEAKIDSLSESPGDSQIALLGPRLYEDIKRSAALWSQKARDCAKVAVLLPTSYFGITKGLILPDSDISLLGIGRHRFFLFHSAFAVWVLSKLYKASLTRSKASAKNFTDRVVDKILGVLTGSLAFGVGVHLLTDVFHPKAVIFPFFGSLIDGTMVDDNIWLLANACWCFKIGADIFVLALGDELTQVKKFVFKTFIQPLMEAKKQ